MFRVATLTAGVLAGILLMPDDVEAQTRDIAALRLTYDVTSLQSGYRYGFKLTLTNEDNRWHPGDFYNLIGFGDQEEAGRGGFFCRHGYECLPGEIFDFSSSNPNLTLSRYYYGSEVPAIVYGAESFNSGWVPNQIGDSLEWSISSKYYLPQGYMYWSTPFGRPQYLSKLAFLNSTDVSPANVPDPADTRIPGVPEPATWAMMLAGFGSVGFAMRRRRSKVTTVVAYA